MHFEYSHLIPSSEHGPHHAEYFEAAMQKRYPSRPLMYYKGNANKKGRRRNSMRTNNIFYGNNMNQTYNVQDSNDFAHTKCYKSYHSEDTDIIEEKENDFNQDISNKT